jgi:tripartite-type tricarboxylate transporter receptor subunit TctC
MRHLPLLAIFALVLAACAPQPTASSPTPAAPASPTVADFYRGKTVTLLVGYSPGGGYDQYGRVLATHIGKHIPGNPTVIVQNMEGAGSILAANSLFTSQPKDGTVFGIFGRGLPANELLGQAEAKFKSTEFNWIGSLNDEVSVCVVRSDAPVKKFEDLYTTTVKIGATGPDDDTGFFPRFLNGAMGTKFQLITGYPGGNDVNLAIERGEVAGRCGFSWSSMVSTKPNWLKDKFVTILTQMSLNKHPDIPTDVPLIMDLAKDSETKQLLEVIFSRQTMGRPFAAPPGVPADRVAALRKAFLDTTKDPEFLADVEKQKLELRPKGGEEIQAIVAKIFQTPQNLRDKLNAVLKQ